MSYELTLEFENELAVSRVLAKFANNSLQVKRLGETVLLKDLELASASDYDVALSPRGSNIEVEILFKTTRLYHSLVNALSDELYLCNDETDAETSLDDVFRGLMR